MGGRDSETKKKVKISEYIYLTRMTLVDLIRGAEFTRLIVWINVDVGRESGTVYCMSVQGP